MSKKLEIKFINSEIIEEKPFKPMKSKIKWVMCIAS